MVHTEILHVAFFQELCKDFSKEKSGSQGHPEINCPTISKNNKDKKYIWKYNVCLPVNTVSDLKLFSLSLAPSLWVGLFYPFGLTISDYV